MTGKQVLSYSCSTPSPSCFLVCEDVRGLPAHSHRHESTMFPSPQCCTLLRTSRNQLVLLGAVTVMKKTKHLESSPVPSPLLPSAPTFCLIPVNPPEPMACHPPDSPDGGNLTLFFQHKKQLKQTTGKVHCSPHTLTALLSCKDLCLRQTVGGHTTLFLLLFVFCGILWPRVSCELLI